MTNLVMFLWSLLSPLLIGFIIRIQKNWAAPPALLEEGCYVVDFSWCSFYAPMRTEQIIDSFCAVLGWSLKHVLRRVFVFPCACCLQMLWQTEISVGILTTTAYFICWKSVLYCNKEYLLWQPVGFFSETDLYLSRQLKKNAVRLKSTIGLS